MSKPHSGHSLSGNFGNISLFQDGAAAPVLSPISAVTDLVVPATAYRLHLIQNTGTTNMTVQLKSNTTLKYGTVSIPNAQLVSFDCAGMGTDPFPDKFTVTPGTSGVVSFWFDCAAEVGATA